MTLLRRVPLPIAVVAGGVLVLLLVPQHVDLPLAWSSAARLLGDAVEGGTPPWWPLQDLADIALFMPVGAVLGVGLLLRLRRRTPKREGSYATFAKPQVAHDQKGDPDAASTAFIAVRQTGQFGVLSARSSSSAAAGSVAPSSTPASASLPTGSW